MNIIRGYCWCTYELAQCLSKIIAISGIGKYTKLTICKPVCPHLGNIHALFLATPFTFFINIIFSLILWVLHIMHPDHTHFLVLPCPPPIPGSFPQNKNNNKIYKNKEKIKPNFCYLYTYRSMVKLSMVCPLSRAESLPSHTPARSHQLWRVILQHHYQFYLYYKSHMKY